MADFASPEVELRVTDAREPLGVDPASVDLVFASNFLEHLDAAEVAVLLPRVREVLVPRGRLILIQPNHRICGDRYFEDPTHRTVFDDRSIVDWLTRYGFSVSRVIPGLLPFSMKSRLPKWPLLVRLYLASSRRPGAAQMYVVAERS